MPAVSILMPCYNVTTTVNEALASLVQQTFTDYEIILVDDGSTDGTLEHLMEWITRDPRIIVLANPHMGIIPALNAGLDACHSPIIARMDADDLSAPNRLERQVEMLESHPELALVTCRVRGFPEENLGAEFRAYIHWLNSLQTGEDIANGMFLKSPLAHPSVAYRLDWVEHVGGYQDHGWAEDYDLWLRLSLAGAKFGKVAEVLLEWRDHPNRLTHTDGRYSPSSDLRIKAHYLATGPLSKSDEVILWGSGWSSYPLAMSLHGHGYRLSRVADSADFQHTQDMQSVPMISQFDFHKKIKSPRSAVVLIAENNTASRVNIIQQLEAMQLQQGIDWWLVG